MKQFVQGVNREEAVLTGKLDDMIDPDNPVRIIDDYVDNLDLGDLGIGPVTASATDEPAYHPADLLKLLIYGHYNQITLARTLEREARRNIEVMWLLRQLTPDVKTISEFRLAHGARVKEVSHKLLASQLTPLN